MDILDIKIYRDRNTEEIMAVSAVIDKIPHCTGDIRITMNDLYVVFSKITVITEKDNMEAILYLVDKGVYSEQKVDYKSIDVDHYIYVTLKS